MNFAAILKNIERYFMLDACFFAVDSKLIVIIFYRMFVFAIVVHAFVLFSAKKPTWDEVVSRVQKFLEHIDRLNIPFILEAKTSTEPLMNKYARLFDLTCSQSEKVRLC